YYSMNASYDSLLSVLMSQALKPIIASLKKEPSSLKLNNKTYTKYSVTDSTFTVDPIPLKDSITHIEMEIYYQVKVADSTKVLRDTTVKSVFDIIKTDNRPMDPNVVLDCHDTILYNVSITAPDRDAAEEGPDNGSIQITRTNSGLGDLTVYYTVQGTASRGTDYTADKSYDSIKFVPGVSSETISIKPITDTLVESDETVVVKLLANKNNRNIRYAINGTDSAVVVIKNMVIIKEDTLDIAVLLNPFSRTIPILEQLASLPESIKKSEMFGKLQQLIGENNSGTILAVKTTAHKDTPVSGKAVLYDALGNVVKKLEIGEIDKRTGDYGAFWDGTNVNNRKVGAGVYLMQVSIDGEKMKSIKVGVKE
ncbi:MAG TPA: Calx-beta domain-containing protein, partial [Chitinispirillaceae bacterium]|nr:Calx-beta domain-containing protein [Chitinispirillaceae bacterium]